MRRAMGGDAEAYGEIFEENRDRIYHLAYAYLHHAAAAEDGVQETFLKGLSAIAGYRGESRPRNWFTSIAINVCRHRIREGKRAEGGASEKALDAGRSLWRPRTRAALSRMVQRESHWLLALAMGYLTESQREVFLLHYLQDLPYDEIAGILGIRPGAARALAHRAKAALRDKLGSEVWIAKNVD